MDAVRGLRIVRDELRARGHKVVEVPGWETRGHGDVLEPAGAVNHWTAGARTGNAPSLRVVTHGRPGLRNALCHTYQDRAATLYIVAARVAWHAGAGSWPGLAGNRDCLGHEPECAGPGDWRPGQLELLADLDVVQALVFNYPLGRIIDHFEWTTRKVDRHDVGGPPWRRRLETHRAPVRLEDDMLVNIEGGRTVYHVLGATLHSVPSPEVAEVIAGPGWRGKVKTITAGQARRFRLIEADDLWAAAELRKGATAVGSSPQGVGEWSPLAVRYLRQVVGADLDAHR
jgi:hypothetical protein